MLCYIYLTFVHVQHRQDTILIYLYHFFHVDILHHLIYLLVSVSNLTCTYLQLAFPRNEVATLVQLFGSVPRLECFQTRRKRRTAKNRNQKDTEILTWPMATVNFKLFGTTYLVGKIKFIFFFRVHWLSECIWEKR